MAFVVVQHMDPAHPSLLPSLLARVTSLPVHEGQQGMVLEPNQIYVAPAQADITLEQGVLQLFPKALEHGRRFAIDAFLSSLAHDRGPQAIGVILSGTATDGTAGLQEIKVEGGTTFAQDESTAAFPYMPHHAIVSGCVDHILPPQDIARELAHLPIPPLTAAPQVLPDELPLPTEQEEQALVDLLPALSLPTGVDFLAYKRQTLIRRVQRRMVMLHLNSLTEYAAYLREHPAEVETLSWEMLIPVTSFFRDETAFVALTRLAFPEIVQQAAPGESIRIWVPGCSTGEEAYSLLICWLEFLQEHHLLLPLQLFATDINPRGLARARIGIYPAEALSMLSPERLERFFVPLDAERSSYRVAREVREQCIFAQHNVLKDPPFTHLDLVSCRNVLIYLSPDSQQQVLRIFHYALKLERFLLLGISESVESFDRLFASVERRQKLYRRKAIVGGLPLFGNPVAGGEATVQLSQQEETAVRGTAAHTPDFRQEVDRLLLANYVPASVVIDSTMDILQVWGHTSFYLELPAGKTGVNLLRMARKGLGPSLRSAISAAKKSQRLVTKEPIQVSAFGTTRDIRITVHPLQGPPAGRHFLVLFEDLTAGAPSSASGRTSLRSTSAGRIAALELEIATLKAEMQEAMEEYEASNEEVQAASEEIHASNEELQSINEELEASQEELQSTNQELLTTNQALIRRNEEVQAARERADAIVETVREPLVVLTKDGRVTRANAAFYQTFQLQPQETEGHLLSELKDGQWVSSGVPSLLEQVARTNEPIYGYEIEQTFPLIGHKVLRLNARQLVDDSSGTGDHGILLALEEITARKELERQKDSLLMLASHELRTPLTSALLLIQRLQQRWRNRGDSTSVTRLEQAEAYLHRLTRLINGFLDLAAIEKGHFSLHRETFAIDELIRDVCTELQHMLPGQPLSIIHNAHVQVYGDRMRTEEVLCNLLTNAVKYAPSDQPIEVRAEEQEAWVTISVRDHGRGLPREQQTSIFERFYRMNNPNQRQQPSGTGLGLYLAATFVKEQGGRIWVESVPGGGATFFFTIPKVLPN